MTLTAAPPERPAAPKSVSSTRAALARIDFVLIGSALLLTIIGAALIYSSTRSRLLADGDDPRAFLDKHLINIFVGVALAWGVSRLGYSTLRALAWWVYGATVVLLVAVLSPLGTVQNGIQAWIELPAGFSVQPSEIAKVALVITVALVLTQLGPSGAADADVRPRLKYVALALVVAAIPIGLIMLQPDLGTVLVIAAMVFGMIAVSGVSSWVLWAMVVLTGAAAAAAVMFGVLDSYQIDRLTTFLDPEADPLGAGYNTRMARLAIAGGGIFGTGLFQGPTTQGGFVPYQQTDFVFSVAGEELGLVGAGLIIVLIGVILMRGIKIALSAPDRYGRVVAAGVVVWIAVQAFENIGMNLGIMPVTGVPLPFVSYGGSSMFALWIGIGLLASVHMNSSTPR